MCWRGGGCSAITWPNFIQHLRYIYSRYDRRASLADPCTLQPSPVTVLELLCVHFMVFLHLRYLCVCVWWSTTTSVNQCVPSGTLSEEDVVCCMFHRGTPRLWCHTVVMHCWDYVQYGIEDFVW